MYGGYQVAIMWPYDQPTNDVSPQPCVAEQSGNVCGHEEPGQFLSLPVQANVREGGNGPLAKRVSYCLNAVSAVSLIAAREYVDGTLDTALSDWLVYYLPYCDQDDELQDFDDLQSREYHILCSGCHRGRGQLSANRRNVLAHAYLADMMRKAVGGVLGMVCHNIGTGACPIVYSYGNSTTGGPA